jgi:hypothetical protein
MYTHFLHWIHPPTLFSCHLPLPTGSTLPCPFLYPSHQDWFCPPSFKVLLNVSLKFLIKHLFILWLLIQQMYVKL